MWSWTRPLRGCALIVVADISCGLLPAMPSAAKQRLAIFDVVSGAGLPLSVSSIALCTDCLPCSITDRSVSFTSSASWNSSSMDSTSVGSSPSSTSLSSIHCSEDDGEVEANTERSGSAGRVRADPAAVVENARAEAVGDAVEARDDDEDEALGEDEDDDEMDARTDDSDGERVTAREVEDRVLAMVGWAAEVGFAACRLCELEAPDLVVAATLATVVGVVGATKHSLPGAALDADLPGERLAASAV